MSQGMNNTVIVGNLGSDPELGTTKNGKSMVKMSVAVNTGHGEYERTDWFPVVAWGKQADACANHLQTGAMVGVEGELRKNTWETDDGEKRSSWELNARKVTFLGGSSGDSSPSHPVQEDDIPY